MGCSVSQLVRGSSPSASGEEFRRKASLEADQMKVCFEESQRAYRRGDRSRAKELSDQGKTHKTNMRQYNELAARKIFEENNANRSLGEIDLHGLHVKEALELFLQRVREAQRAGVHQLVVIVGRGNHSTDGVARIKPAIRTKLNELGLHFEADAPNPGCFTVQLKQPRPCVIL